MIRLMHWITAGLIGAAAVHIVMVFLIPRLSDRDLTSRLLALGPANTLNILDDAAVERTISFADRTALYAVCPFDLSEGSIALVAEAGEVPMSLVFLKPGGGIFSALTDKVSTQGLLQLRLLTEEQLRELVDSEDGDIESPELRLQSPTERGAILIKALVTTESRKALAQEALQRTRCGAL